MTYDYCCQKCGAEFTLEQKITDPPATQCTVQGCKGAVRRFISAAPAFTLKGTGWYRDGYR